MNSVGISTPEFVELSPHSGAEIFHSAIGDAKMGNKHGAAVTQYEMGDYRKPGMRLFITPDRSAGFALNGDDIISVFNNPKGPHRNISGPMMHLATAQGGRRLDAFDTELPLLYSMGRFNVTSRTPFVDEFAPDGWNYRTFGQYRGRNYPGARKSGRPDVVFMNYNPKSNLLYRGDEGSVAPGYDEAAEMQQMSPHRWGEFESGEFATVRPKKLTDVAPFARGGRLPPYSSMPAVRDF